MLIAEIQLKISKTTALNRFRMIHCICTYFHGIDDVTGKTITSSKKLLYQNIPLVMDNSCTKFHDVTICGSKVIEGGANRPPLPPVLKSPKKPSTNRVKSIIDKSLGTSFIKGLTP